MYPSQLRNCKRGFIGRVVAAGLISIVISSFFLTIIVEFCPEYCQAAEVSWLEPQYSVVGDEALFDVTDFAQSSEDYHWTFGDGQTGAVNTQAHRYESRGTYTAELSLRKDDNWYIAARQQVHVTPSYDVHVSLPYRGVLISHTHSHLNPPQAQADFSPTQANRFYDLVEWKQTLDDLHDRGYNAICFLDKHPFPRFISLPGYPEALEISKRDLDRNQHTLRAILEMAAAREITVDLLVYNIHTPQAVCERFGIELHEDTLSSREYMASAIKIFYQTFPGFGRIVLTMGEHPGGCVDYCRDAFVRPLCEMPRQPSLIIRDQMTSVESMKRLTEDLENWHILAKISEEQYLGDTLSPLGWLHHRSNGHRTIYLQGAHPPGFFDGCYEQVRDLIRKVRLQRGQGVLVQMSADQGGWLALAAYGYYMNHSRTSVADDKRFFSKIIHDRFGENVPAEALLEAGDAGGRVLPTIRKLFYSRNWHYMAEFGLFLDQMMSMPTASSFERYNSGGGEFVSWLPRENRFEKDYLTIAESVERSAGTANQVSAEESASQLAELGERIRTLLPTLRLATPARDKAMWDQQLAELECLSELAQFYASKIRASIAWYEWKSGTANDEKATSSVREYVGRALEMSIEHYAKAANLYGQTHEQPQSILMVASGPSSGWSYDGEIRLGMSQLVQLFEIEKNVVVQSFRNKETTLPKFRDLVD